MTGRIRIGVGGWTFEPWRGTFYPDELAQKRELEYASRKLTSIEINGTYYGSQKPESFARWHDETPDDFVFAVKGPRFATNRRVLAEAGESIERFFASGVMELKDKLGPVNWQFMATKKFDPDDFAAFLALLPDRVEGRAVRHAVEVRHASFATADFVALARAQAVAVVVAGDADYPADRRPDRALSSTRGSWGPARTKRPATPPRTSTAGPRRRRGGPKGRRPMIWRPRLRPRTIAPRATSFSM